MSNFNGAKNIGTTFANRCNSRPIDLDKKKSAKKKRDAAYQALKQRDAAQHAPTHTKSTTAPNVLLLREFPATAILSSNEKDTPAVRSRISSKFIFCKLLCNTSILQFAILQAACNTSISQ